MAVMIAIVAAALPLAPPGRGAERVPVAADWENLQTFYDAHEECDDFMPFGLYGFGGGSKFGTIHKVLKQYDSDRTGAEMHLDSLVAHNFNSIWGSPFVDLSDPQAAEYEEWFYGGLVPRYEMRVLPSANGSGFRADSATFAGMQRRTPPLSPAEIAEAERRLAVQLAHVKTLSEKHPQSILGIVTDDEPENMATAVACARLVEKHTGKLVTFPTPNFYNVRTGYAEMMMPITGDLYYTWDAARSGWMVTDDVRWLARNRPGRLFWLMPLACAWSAHEPTLPDMPDGRPTREELRQQCWSALALGTKGFYFFQQGEWCFSWGEGQDGVFDVLKRENDHHDRQNLAAELRDIGRDFTTIGPSLLRAYPAVEPVVPVACGRVRFPSFKGPAVDCGLLRDPRTGRDFLIPWNNDVDHEQTGRLTVPAELLASGRFLHDLHDLRPIETGPDRSVEVTLPPGGGRVFLIGSAEDFAAVRDSILRHRVRPGRVHARSLLRRRGSWPRQADGGVFPDRKADEFISAARAAEKEGDWQRAADAYRGAVAELRAQDPTAAIDAILEQAGKSLSTSDDMLRTHGQTLFGIISRSYRGYGDTNQMFGDLPIAPEIGQWTVLSATYVSLKQQLFAGEVEWGRLDRLKATARKLAADAEANAASFKAKFTQRIKESRRPHRVAYVTADRDGIDEIRTYAWAFRSFRVKWIAPDEEGVLRDIAGREFDPAEYDVIWVHQLMSRQPPEEEVKADPEAVLLAPLLEPTTRDAIRGFVKGGGGLLLTGVAGLYAIPLGVETVAPDRFQETGPGIVNHRQGIIPAVGAERHPALAHVPPKGVLVNGGGIDRGWTAFAECVWDKQRPRGTVVAEVMTEGLERTEWAAIVEYALGRGKIIVVGGMCCSLTPGMKFGNQDLPRAIVLDTIGYLAGPERFGGTRTSAR